MSKKFLLMPQFISILGHDVKIKRLLLHVCCAPCAGAVIENLLSEGFELTLYFFNPNVFPYEEYLIRKQSIMKFAFHKKVAFVDADYHHESWMLFVKGMEKEPERGRRCSLCFDYRLNSTAQYAKQNGFKVFATTNGMGRLKDIKQVNQSGLRTAALYDGLIFWDINWRKNSGLDQAREVTKREGFYQQKYCGCSYSMPKPLVEIQRHV